MLLWGSSSRPIKRANSRLRARFGKWIDLSLASARGAFTQKARVRRLSRIANAVLTLLLVTFIKAFVFTDKGARLANDLVSVINLNLKVRFLGNATWAKSHRAVSVMGGIAANRHDMWLLDICRCWRRVILSSFSWRNAVTATAAVVIIINVLLRLHRYFTPFLHHLSRVVPLLPSPLVGFL